MPAGRFRPKANQKPVVKAPTQRQQQARGGAVLRRQTFQPENRKQQAGLHADVVAEGNRLERVHQQQAAHAKAQKLYSQGKRKEAVALERNAGLMPKGIPTHVLPGEKLPVLGQLIASVDPVVTARTIAHNLTTVPWHQPRGQINAAIVGGKFGGEFPKVPQEGALAPKIIDEAGANPAVADEQMRSALQRSPAKYRETKALRSPERGKRIAAGEGAFHSAGGGVRGFYAKTGQLKGKLPSVEFNDLRNLGEHEVDHLVNKIEAHPNLRGYEKTTAQRAFLQAVDEGRPFTPSERRHLTTVFGEDAVKQAEHISKLKRAGQIGLGIANIPRSLMSSFDFSFPLRQGFGGLLYDPVGWARTLKPMVKAGRPGERGEQFYQNRLLQLHQDPAFEHAAESGVRFTEMGPRMRQREEQFPSSYAEHLNLPTGPKGERFASGVGPGQIVRASGRAYTLAADELRLTLWKKVIARAQKRGINIEDPKFRKSAARFVNTNTGRGGLGKKLEPAAPALNTLIFSPRLMASRIDTFIQPFDPRLHPFIRREAQKQLLKIGAVGAGATGIGLAAGGKAGYDPRSADFAKIRFGNTRIDPLAGYQQYIRLAAQEGTRTTISSTTGKVQKLGKGFSASTQEDILKRFLTQKMAPVPSFIDTLLKQKNAVGQKVVLQNELTNRLVPLTAQDAYSLYQDKKNPAAAAAGYLASGFGVGIQTYGPRQIAKDVEKQGKALPQTIMEAAKKAGINASITPEMKREIKVMTARQASYGQIRQTKGDLTPADRFVSDIKLLVKNGIGDAKQAREAAQWAKNAKPSDLKRAEAHLSRNYFSHPNLSYAVKVLKDHGQTVKLPRGG